MTQTADLDWQSTYNSIAQQWLVEPQASVIQGAPLVPQPDPSWLSSLAKPWAEFGTGLVKAAGSAVESTYDQLPQRLFDWGMDKLGGSTKRTVRTGPGTSTTYVLPANPGAAPATPNYTLPPPFGPGIIPVQVPVQTAGGSMSTIMLVGIGLIIWMVMRK